MAAVADEVAGSIIPELTKVEAGARRVQEPSREPRFRRIAKFRVEALAEECFQ
jgi:hypothetical protein